MVVKISQEWIALTLTQFNFPLKYLNLFIVRMNIDFRISPKLFVIIFLCLTRMLKRMEEIRCNSQVKFQQFRESLQMLKVLKQLINNHVLNKN